MTNFNRVILAGNMTRDPELASTPSGASVCKFGLAVNRTWNDRQTNERREESTFVDCTAWARQAEVINQYFSKGKPILVEGRLAFDSWTSPEGQKRSKLYVVVEKFEFVGGGGGAGGGGAGGGGDRGTYQSGGAPASGGQGGGFSGPQGGGGASSQGASSEGTPSQGSGSSYESAPSPGDVPF